MFFTVIFQMVEIRLNVFISFSLYYYWEVFDFFSLIFILYHETFFTLCGSISNAK